MCTFHTLQAWSCIRPREWWILLPRAEPFFGHLLADMKVSEETVTNVSNGDKMTSTIASRREKSFTSQNSILVQLNEKGLSTS